MPEGASVRVTTPSPSFEVARDEFVAAFNREAVLDKSQGLSDCADQQDGSVACRIGTGDMTAAREAARHLAVEVPGMKDYNGEYVTLQHVGDKLSRLMIAGDRRVFGAGRMASAVGNAARALGKEDAARELGDGESLVRFIDAIGLLREPPKFGTQVSISRPYAEITCTLMTEQPLVYACFFSPPGNVLTIDVK